MTVNEDFTGRNLESKDHSSAPIIFKATTNMLNANIKEFILNGSDFEITFTDSRKRCIQFSSKDGSISRCTKKIQQKLSSELKGNVEPILLNLALGDIESELISRRVEIFQLANNLSNISKQSHSVPDDRDSANAIFFEDIKTIRHRFNESIDPFKQWQSAAAEKYNNLQLVLTKHYPEAWSLLEFCLSVKSILNIEGFTLPFMGVLLAIPSSMKTMIIQLFRKYPNSFYSDSFTPNSLVSHNSALTEEQLQQIDMLPKMKDKVFLTPELAPIFTAKEDELQKILGMITRILDGHGFENDSGAHGHRRYGDTMFVWIGAAVEIPYKVWKMLGTLGHKIYFFRPELSEKTVEQLKQIAKSNNFEANFKEIEDALLEYLKVFDAAPDTEQITRDKSGIVKVRWNGCTKNVVQQEQDKAIEYIAEVSKLLAHLRGTVYISETKSTRRKYNDGINIQHQQQSDVQQPSQPQLLYSDASYQVDGPDYDTDLPIIEDPSRAVILLRNLAIGHAVSRGRDTIELEDVPIPIKVALSTAMYNRIKIFDLLSKNNGEITTSDITKGLRISEPTARRTMREFHALKIADISAVTQYSNAELKITLRPEYGWFKTEEFKNLREGLVRYVSTDAANVQDNHFYDNSDSTRDLCDKYQGDASSGACDSLQCHTLKVSSPPDADEKNNSVASNNQQHDKGTSNLEPENVHSYIDNTSDIEQTISNDEGTPEEQSTQCGELTATTNSESIFQEQCTQHDIIKIDISDITEKNNPRAWESNDFQRVTPSDCHTPEESALRSALVDLESLSLQEILFMIKAANGSQVVVNACIVVVHSSNEQVRNYLGDNLTSRDNRRVRKLYLKIIRDDNIEVIKYKPQLVVKWVESNSSESKATAREENSVNRGDSP